METNELVKLIVKEVIEKLGTSSNENRVLIYAKKGCSGADQVLKYLGDKTTIVWAEEKNEDEVFKRRIVPFITCNQMADLSAGKAVDPVMRNVLKDLLYGNKIEVFQFEYCRYKETAAEELVRLYESYEEKLALYGLTIIEEINETKCIRKALVSEKDIITANENGARVLKVPATAIITPLAVECARDLNVELLKK